MGVRRMNFEKAFNIGLTLDTTLKQFDVFLKKYHGYIRSFYFSPPLGWKFHTRAKITLQLLSPFKRRLFWKMLRLIQSYGIELELLFNTLYLDDGLILKAKKLLIKKGIEVDSVAFLGRYFPSVKKYFPDKKYIWSFNNGLRTRREFEKIVKECEFDTIVLGSNFIRDNEFFKEVTSHGKKIILLLNNGCSFNCATCSAENSLCGETFEKNLTKNSVEYLYALQSIFPDELYKGIIDASFIDCFKISNRGSKLAFAAEAMDSFITGSVRSYLEKDKNAYAYWGRAGFFWKYFPNLDLEKIIEYKKEILGAELEVK